MTILLKTNARCQRFSLGFVEHPILLQDSWHSRDARLILTSGTEDEDESLTLVRGVKQKKSEKVKGNRQEFGMALA